MKWTEERSVSKQRKEKVKTCTTIRDKSVIICKKSHGEKKALKSTEKGLKRKTRQQEINQRSNEQEDMNLKEETK